MSKPTILILSIVYLASVLIVGIFGMQVMSFNNPNYIQSITLNVEEIVFSRGKADSITREEKEETTEEDETNKYIYYQFFYNGVASIEVKEEEIKDNNDNNDKNNSYMKYTIYYDYIKNELFTITINPILTFIYDYKKPENPNLSVSSIYDNENNKNVTYEAGTFKVSGKGVATYTFSSQDFSNKKLMIVIYPTKF